MSEHLAPYPAYKPTAIPWLQQVPEHWSEMKVKYIFRERVQKGYPNEPLLAATQSMGVVTKETYGERTVTAQKDLHLLKLVEKGDFVISLRSFQGGIEISHARGIISPAYTILKVARKCHPHYLAYLLKSAPFIDGLKLFITGIREGQNIDYARLARTYLPWPEPNEQHLIVRYLHALDAKVKRYIRAKRSLIARLQEQKQAIIQRAVTRGLAPHVKLKPSSVEWLGEVPEHWEVRRSKTLFTERKERSRADDIQLSATQAYGVIAQDDFEARVGRRVVKLLLHQDKRKHVELDDFVISMRSFQGGLERAWAQGAIRSSYVILKPGPEVEVNYFTYLLKAPQYIKALQSTADFIRDGQDLNFADFSRVSLPLPPKEEQSAIADSIKRALEGLENAIEKIGKEIVLIQEHHTRLIADVVTGAVDVRAAALALPVDQMISGSEDQIMEPAYAEASADEEVEDEE